MLVLGESKVVEAEQLGKRMVARFLSVQWFSARMQRICVAFPRGLGCHSPTFVAVEVVQLSREDLAFLDLVCQSG